MIALFQAYSIFSVIHFQTTAIAFLSYSRSISSSHYLRMSSVDPVFELYRSKPLRENVTVFCAEVVSSDANSSTPDEKNPPAVQVILQSTPDNNDFSTARGWMEHLEQRDGPIYGVGAYTVLRSDVVFSPDFMGKDENGLDDLVCRVWGMDFHLNRLLSSYTSLLESQHVPLDEITICSNCTSFLENVKQDTVKMVTVLMEEAIGSFSEGKPLELSLKNITFSGNVEEIYHPQKFKYDDKLGLTMMITVLWTRSKSHNNDSSFMDINPQVRGHLLCSGLSHPYSLYDMEEMPMPISTCLALPEEPTFEALASLPHRYNRVNNRNFLNSSGASAKISSWCRIRRPLEDPARYKVPGLNVGEVLLLEKTDDASCDLIKSLEILEGLTTNFFVVYKDGTVRTAPTNKVLEGYSRYLVLNELKKGLVTQTITGAKLLLDDICAPTVQDALAGYWSEVFVTSAIRVVTPVNRVLIPSSEGLSLEMPEFHVKNGQHAQMSTLWQSNHCEDRDVYGSTRVIRSAVFRTGLQESTIFGLHF